MKFAWIGGAAFLRIRMNGNLDWGYCGTGTRFDDVPPAHFDAAISSLLGWDHPVARQVAQYVKSLTKPGAP